MDWAFSHLSSRGQSLLWAATDTIPHVSQAGLPVCQAPKAGQFLQEHPGRCLCGFLCGPCDDPRKQEEIQNCLKAQSQDSLKSQTSNKRLGWGQPAACLQCCFLYVSKKLPPVYDCTLVNNFSCRCGQQMLLLPEWTLQCVYNRDVPQI